MKGGEPCAAPKTEATPTREHPVGRWHPLDETTARLNSQLSRLDRLIDQAHTILDRVQPPGFVAWSGGKDSTVAAWIADQHWPGIPIVSFRCGLEYPETLEYEQTAAAAFGWNWSTVRSGDMLPLMVRSGLWDMNGVADPDLPDDWWFRTLILGPAAEAHRLHGPLIIWGLRANESKRRSLMLLSRNRRGIVERADGTTTCAPLLNWHAADVFAAHYRAGVAPNPVYARFAELGTPVAHRRVDVMVGADGVQHGRLAWLQAGWPDEYNRLARSLPRMRHMT